VRGTDVEVRRRVVAELVEEGRRGASPASGLHGWMRGSAVKVVQGSGWSGDSPVSRNCMADGKLTGVGIGDSGRCRGWGSESEIREDPWGRVEAGQKLVGAGMPQGGVAAVEQRLCSGGAMGRGLFRVRGGDAWVDGCREAVGG